MAIHNISYPLGFFGFTQSGPKLPQWYTDYYSQEDILQSAAEVIQRLVAWTDIILEDIITLTDAVNDAIGFDPTQILAELSQLNADVAALKTSDAANTAQITALNTLTSGLQTAITGLTARVVTLETKVSNLETENQGILENLDDLNERVDVSDDYVQELGTVVANVDLAVLNLTNTVNEIEPNVNAALDAANQALTEVGTYDGRLTDLESTVGGLESNVNQAVEDANTALAEVGSYSDRIDQAESNAQQAVNATSGLADQIVTLDNRVLAVEGDTEALESGLSNLASDQTALGNQLTTVANEAAAATVAAGEAQADVAALSSSVSGLPARVATLEGEIVTERGRITTTNSNVSSLTTRVTTAENSINGINSSIIEVNGSITDLSESLTETQGDVATNATNIAALQAAAGANAFHYSRGNGVIAIDVDNNEKVFLPLQIPFASSNATYQYKRTTRTDPVAVPGAIHYITNADGSNGMLYVYDERGLSLTWGQLDNLAWNFNSAPPTGRFIPLISGTPDSRAFDGAVAKVSTWVRPEDAIGGSLVNLPINALLKTNAGGSPAGNQFPTGQYSVAGTWMVPTKLSLVRLTQNDITDGGGTADFELSDCFDTFTSVPSYGPPPTITLVANAGWTAYSSGKDLSSVSSELMFLAEGMVLPSA